MQLLFLRIWKPSFEIYSNLITEILSVKCEETGLELDKTYLRS